MPVTALPASRYHVTESVVLLEGWEPYEGPRGGKGWRKDGAGKPRYQVDKPGERDESQGLERTLSLFPDAADAPADQPLASAAGKPSAPTREVAAETGHDLAAVLVSQGFEPSFKPFFDPTQFEYGPGKGIERDALYVNDPKVQDHGYGDVRVVFRAPQDQLDLPEELKQYGTTPSPESIEEALRDKDGAVVRGRLGPEAIDHIEVYNYQTYASDKFTPAEYLEKFHGITGPVPKLPTLDEYRGAVAKLVGDSVDGDKIDDTVAVYQKSKLADKIWMAQEVGLVPESPVADYEDVAEKTPDVIGEPNLSLPGESRPSLTPEQASEVRRYLVDPEFYLVNKRLRSGGSLGNSVLQDAINKSQRFPVPVKVVRGIEVDDIDEFAASLVDGEFIDPGFVSTSTHGAFPGNVQFHILAHRGLDASYYGDVNVHEMLLPAGSRFRVLDVKKTGGVLHVSLEQQTADDGIGDEPLKRQTKSPEFKRWFGNSRVVDESGEPLVVYHGTSDAIDEFDPSVAKPLGGFGGEAVFFTDTPEVASGYANQGQTLAVKRSLLADQQADEEVQAYVRKLEEKTGSRAPESSDNRVRWLNDLLDSGQVARDEYDRYHELADASYEREYGPGEDLPDATPNVIPVYLSLQNPLVVDAKGMSWDWIVPRHMETVDRSKYDGIIFRNVKDSGDDAEYTATTYAVFRPEQVKSAIGNRGTFDRAKRKINESVAFEGFVTTVHSIPRSESPRLSELANAFMSKSLAARQVRLFESWDASKHDRDTGGRFASKQEFEAHPDTMFHGTHPDAAERIEREGFDQTRSGERQRILRGGQTPLEYPGIYVTRSRDKAQGFYSNRDRFPDVRSSDRGGGTVVPVQVDQSKIMAPDAWYRLQREVEADLPPEEKPASTWDTDKYRNLIVRTGQRAKELGYVGKWDMDPNDPEAEAVIFDSKDTQTYRSVAGALATESEAWDPNEHPRGEGGLFADKGEGGLGGGTVDTGGGERQAKYRDVRRSHKTPVVEFPKPIVGPSGAKLTSYEWMFTNFEDVDDRGELKVRRISDWEQAATNEQTGRDIVHHFHVTDQDGRGQVVSLESALKLLGYLKSDKSAGVGNIKTLATALKKRALSQLELQQREDLEKRFDAARAETRAKVDKLTPPPLEQIEADGEFSRYRVGDAEQWQMSTRGATNEVRKELEEDWRKNRLAELFPLELGREAAQAKGAQPTDAEAKAAAVRGLDYFKQETETLRQKLKRLDRQVEILAAEAAESASGAVSGPAKHRAALRQLDDTWAALQIGADGRKYQDPLDAAKTIIKARGTENWNDSGRENGAHEMQEIVKDLTWLTGRNWQGLKTDKALQADEIPKREVYGSWKPAISASPDKKVTKWYMDNKEDIEDVLKRIEQWKSRYAPPAHESYAGQQGRLFETEWDPDEHPRLKDGTWAHKGTASTVGNEADTPTKPGRQDVIGLQVRGKEYVYRPEAQQRDPHGKIEGDFTQRELAAHIIDRELGGGLVPPTEYFTGEHGTGSRQPAVAGRSPASLPDLPAGQQQVLAAFDFLIGAADRKPSHVKIGDDGRPVAVSNNKAFYCNRDLAEFGFRDPEQRPKELTGEGLAFVQGVIAYQDQLRPQLSLLLPDENVDDVFVRAKMLLHNQRNLQTLFTPEGFAAALEVQQVHFPSVGSERPFGDSPETYGESPLDMELPESMADRAFVGADRYEEFEIRFNQSLRDQVARAGGPTLEVERNMDAHLPARIRRDVASQKQDAPGVVQAERLLETLGAQAEHLPGDTPLEKVTGAVIDAMNRPSQANRPLAQGIQYAAAELYGGKPPAWADRSLYDEHRETFQAIARGIYANTQQTLRRAGIPGMVLYRGVDLTPQPEEFNRLWDTAHAGSGAVRAVDGIDVRQQPVASWTQNPYLAHNAAVGYGSNRQLLIGAWIPAEKIFSLPISGSGDGSTQEVLTLGEYKPERTRAILFNDWRYTLDDKHMMGPFSAVGSHSHEWFWGDNPRLTDRPGETTAAKNQRQSAEGGFQYAAGDEPEPGFQVLRPHSVEMDGDTRVETYVARDKRGRSQARTILLQVRNKPYQAAEGWLKYEGPKHGKGWQNTETGEVKYGGAEPGTGRKTAGGNPETDRSVGVGGGGEPAELGPQDLRGPDAVGSGDRGTRAGAGGLGDVGLPEEVRRPGAAGEPDGGVRGLDGAAVSVRSTDTPEFKTWFGDSKVVDEVGNPLRVFHGTAADEDIEEFRPEGSSKWTRAVWFSAQPDMAEIHANRRQQAMDVRGDKSVSPARIIPVFLALKNPKIIDLANSNEPPDHAAIADAREEGNDGVIFKNAVDGKAERQDVFAVFDGAQVKSATGNRGTYRGPKITESTPFQSQRVLGVYLDRDPGIAGWLHRYKVFLESEAWSETRVNRDEDGQFTFKDAPDESPENSAKREEARKKTEAAYRAPTAHKYWNELIDNNSYFVRDTDGIFKEKIKSIAIAQDVADRMTEKLGLSRLVILNHDEELGDQKFRGRNIKTLGNYNRGDGGKVSHVNLWQKGQTLQTLLHELAHHLNRDLIGEDPSGQVHGARFNKSMRVVFDAYLDEIGFPLRLDDWIKQRDSARGQTSESVPFASHPIAQEAWVEYHGPRKGEGWQNTETGEVAYVDEMPGRRGQDGPDETGFVTRDELKAYLPGHGGLVAAGEPSPVIDRPQLAPDVAAEPPPATASKAPKAEPVRFKVRGQGEWEWDGNPPERKGALGGLPHYRVTRLSDGATGTLQDYSDGWVIRLDNEPSYRAAAKGTKNPILAKQKAVSHKEERLAAGDESAGKAGREAAIQRMETALADVQLPKGFSLQDAPPDILEKIASTKRIATETWSKVVDRFGPKALEAIGELTAVKMYADQLTLEEALLTSDRKGVQGVYRHNDKTGELMLSGAGVVDQEGTYAHELTHAVDGPQSVYSSARKWRNAWREEIGSKEENRVGRVKLPGGEIKELVGKSAEDIKPGDRLLLGDGVAKFVESAELVTRGRMGKVLEVKLAGVDELQMWNPKANFYDVDAPEAEPAPLSRYGQTSASEGFAEFGRLLVRDPEAAKKKFPKCYKCWKEWHLVEE